MTHLLNFTSSCALVYAVVTRGGLSVAWVRARVTNKQS
jgi:hypothetical protein